MAQSKHTPGSWTYSVPKDGSEPTTINGPASLDHAEIATISYVGGPEELDARLIAAAPKMLEALQGILWKLERKESASGDGTDCKWARIDRNDATIEEARAAIRAATGGED